MKLWKNGKTTEKKVYLLPKELDEEVARLHLNKLGAKLTKLTTKQADVHRRQARRAVQARHVPLLIVSGSGSDDATMRADQLLVERGIVPTRSAAQRLIAVRRGALAARRPAGACRPRRAKTCRAAHAARPRSPTTPSLASSRAAARSSMARWRGPASTRRGDRALDVGDVHRRLHRLPAAARRRQVVGIEVGHGQLDERLAADARVTALREASSRAISRLARTRRSRRLRPDRRRPVLHLHRWCCRPSCRCRRRPPAARSSSRSSSSAGRTSASGASSRPRRTSRPRREAPARAATGPACDRATGSPAPARGANGNQEYSFVQAVSPCRPAQGRPHDDDAQ